MSARFRAGGWLVLALLLVVGIGWLVMRGPNETAEIGPAKSPARTESTVAANLPPVLPDAQGPLADAPDVVPADSSDAPQAAAVPVTSRAPDEPRQLRIVVVDVQAVPVSGARIRVWLKEEACLADETTAQEFVSDSRGRATVTMSTADSVLLAEREDVGTSGLWRRNAVGYGANLDGETPIPLLASSSLHGVVLEADDRPASGATIHFWRYGGGAARTPRTPRDAIADTQGRFECTVDAEAFVAMQAQDGERRTLEERVEVGVGTNHEVVLRFPGDWWVAGTVVDAAGQPVEAGRVRLWLDFPGYDSESGIFPKENCYSPDTKSAVDGSFRFTLPKLASYTLLASAEGRPASDPVSVEIDTLHPSATVTLTLPEPAAIGGRLHTDDDRPLPGVEIRAAPGGNFFPIADLYGPTKPARFGTATGVTDDDGRFRIEGLHPRGGYALSCRPDPGHPKRRLAHAEVPAGTLDVDWTVRESELIGCVVTGTVLSDDGQPVTAFSIDLVQRTKDGYFRQNPREFTDPGGRFRLEGLAAGESYGMFIASKGWASAEVTWWTASEEGQEVVVRLERPGMLEVEVRDEQGLVAGLAQVSAKEETEVPRNRGFWPAHTDETGLARFDALDPGRYHLVVTRGDRRAEADVDVAAGTLTHRRIDLRSP